MTGRDLIIYILQNKLEDEVIVKDGVFVGMTSVEEVAAKCGVGVATVKAWYELGAIKGIKFGETLYLFNNPENIFVANRLSKT